MAGISALLDSCILYPARLRDLLLSLAAADLFRPIWSQMIHEEWMTGVLTNRLIDYWRGRLGKAERLIIETLTQAYPAALNKEEIAARAGYEANGGGFNNALGRLRSLELVRGRGELRASDDLFDRGA